MSTCEHADCTEPAIAKKLCRRHYDRSIGRHRHRTDKVLPNRARTRALTILKARHLAEYDAIYAEQLRIAQGEADLIAEAGKQNKLLPGPRPDDQTPTDRVADAIGKLCPNCKNFHRAGHRCTNCRSRTPEQRIEDLLRAGKSAQWIIANAGEPARLVFQVLRRLQSTG